MTNTTPQNPVGTRLDWRPIVWFYLITMVAAGVLDLLQPLTHINTQIVEIVQFAPTVAVGVLFMKSRGRLAPRIGSFRPTGLMPVVLAAVAIIGACIGVYVVPGTHLPVLNQHGLVAPLLLIVVAQFIGACGEEIGWRGWLQPTLEKQFSTVGAAAIVGLLWGAWHVQVFAGGVLYACGFLVGAVSMSVIIALLIRRTPGHNLLFAATFHLLINLGLLFVMDEEDGNWVPVVVFGCASAAVCVITMALRAGARIDTMVQR